MPISNVTVTANTATISVSTTDPANVTVAQTTTNVSVGSATIIANSDIRAAISVTDTGGDGSLTYTESTGVITYTGPSAAEVRAHLSATDPAVYNSSTGVISLNNTTLLSGQTTDNLTEGTNNIYFSTSGAAVNTDNLPQGSTNLYFSNALARNAIISGIGIDYNNTTGQANVNHIAASRINTADNVFLHDDEVQISGGNFNPSTAGLRGVKITPRKGSGAGTGSTGDFIFTGMYVKDVSNMEDGFPVIGIGDDISQPGFQFVRLAGTLPESINSVLATFKSDDTFLVSGNIDSNSSINVAGDIIGGGNLEITGNINYREVEDLLVRDQEIYLNYGNASAQTSTIYVDRSGSGAANTFLRWNESADKWQFSNDGSSIDNIGAGTSTLGTINTGTFITGGPVSTGNITIDLDTSATDGRYTKVITAGTGLSGAGTAGDVTLNVGEGNGITVAADTVALNVAYTRNQFSAGGSLSYDSGTGQFSFTERSNADILNLVDADFESDASIHRIAKLRGTEFKIASNATNLQNDVYSYAFPNDDGTNGQALITDGNGTLSFGAVATTYGDANVEALLSGGTITGNITTTGNVNGGFFYGDGAGLTNISSEDTKTVIKTVIAGEDLAKGDAVYISGGTGDNPEVSKADADDASKMPVFGVTTEAVTATNTTDLVIYGLVNNFDTTGLTTGDSLFVSTTAGQLTTTKPTGESSLLQTVGKVIKGNSAGGKITVTGAGRTNATPNLDNGNIFIGNGSNQAVTADFTDTANLAIADYTGDMLEVNNVDVQDTLTVTNGLIVESGGSANLEFSTGAFNFGILKVGPGNNNTGYLTSSFFDYGGKSIICDENLYVGRGLNFSRTALNINTRYNSNYTHFVGTGASASANVYVNMSVGQVTGSPAGNVANATVGIKTHDGQGYILGWHDPIDGSTVTYDAEPSFNPSTQQNGWYAFKDLAKTTVAETFDSDLTVSGKLSMKQFNETVVALGSQSGNLAALASLNAANGSIFTVTATGDITLSQIPNATAGSSFTFFVTQDGTGSRLLTSTFKYQGGDKTLTTAAGNTDVISVVYDGSNYFATLSKDYY